MVVQWHKLGEVENKSTVHNSIVLAIFVPKIIKVGENPTILTVFLTRCTFQCCLEDATNWRLKIFKDNGVNFHTPQL